MKYHEWDKRAWLAGFLLMITIMALVISKIPGCGSAKPEPPAGDDAVDGTPTDDGKDDGGGAGTDDGGSDDGGQVACGEVGDARLGTCPAGKIGNTVEQCQANGKWLVTATDCKDPGQPACTKSEFADAKPILDQYCLSCHVSPGKITDYAVAKAWAGEIIRRMNLPAQNNDHMPKGTAPQLEDSEKQILRRWVDDGALEKCADIPPTEYDQLDDIEGAILEDLNTLPVDDRPNARYLVTTHMLDGQNLSAGGTAHKAIDKALNGLNDVTQDIFLATDVGRGIFRFDLQTYGMDRNDWLAIEQADKLEQETFTTQGQIIKALTNTRKPYFHGDNFIDVTHRNSAIYYRLLGIPAKIGDLQAKIGVRFNTALRDLDTTFIGNSTSRIAEQKNRLVVRVSEDRTQDAYYWQSFDINQIVDAKKNLFQFPLLQAVGGQSNYRFDASEVIYTLPNGLQAYALFDGIGNRQNAAPVDVVTDVDSPLSPVINNANSCSRCHNAGLIPMQDQILSHVTANASQFPSGDVQLVKRIYKGANAVNATFLHDNGLFARALTRLGLSALEKDPLNVVTDRLLLNWNLRQASSFLFLSDSDFLQALETSAVAKAQIGQLATGGTVTFVQFQQVLPQLVKDARLFQDPLGQ